MRRLSRICRAAIVALPLTAGACATGGGTPPPAAPAAQSSPAPVVIVQPGAPGQPGRVISAEQATAPPARHTADDVRFIHGMLAHHAQAIEMTALRADRSASEDLRLMALRIELSQADEIKMMQQWLTARGEALADAHAHHTGPTTPMPGMATPDEMSRLAAARGNAFDRLFLELMIKHHQGALVMVDDLFATAGAGQDSDLFAFASDVVDDQRIEIDRMAAMLMERQK